MIKSPQKLSSQETFHTKWERLLPWAVLLVVFIAYSPTLSNNWTNWDDDRHVLQNPTIKSLDCRHILQIFSTSVNKIYIPLTSLSFAVEHAIVGFHPFLFHFDNLLLHLSVTYLIYLIGFHLGLSRRASCFASLLFGIHPIHVESVAWITERKDVLYAFLYLCAVYQHLLFLENKNGKNFYLCILFGFLSILAKPMAISLPIILILIDWFKGEKISISLVRKQLPLFIITGLVAWITYQEHVRWPVQTLSSALLTWIWSFTFYIQKFLYPFGLTPLYRLIKPVDLFTTQYLWATLQFIIILYSLWIWRKSKWYVFGWGYYFLSIFFILRFDDIADVNIVADRFMYLPSLGFCLAFGMCLERISVLRLAKTKILILFIFFGCIFAGLAFLTYRQTIIWRNSINLWTHELKYYPNEALALNSRGAAYHMEGRLPEALADLTRSLHIKSDDAKVFNNRGLVYTDLNQIDLALQDFNQAIQLNPAYANAFNNRGIIYDKTGRAEDALSDFNKAIKLDPTYQQPYNNRGVLYKNHSKFDLALKDFQTLLQLNPNSWEGYYNCGNLYTILGEYTKALTQYTQALRIQPNFIGAYMQRANLQASLGNYTEAIKDYTKIIQLKPQHAGAYYQRAQIYLKLGFKQDAIKDTEKAKQLGLSSPQNHF